MKKSISEVREPEGNEKINSHNSGMGIRGFHSWDWTGTGIPAHPCADYDDGSDIDNDDGDDSGDNGVDSDHDDDRDDSDGFGFGCK